MTKPTKLADAAFRTFLLTFPIRGEKSGDTVIARGDPDTLPRTRVKESGPIRSRRANSSLSLRTVPAGNQSSSALGSDALSARRWRPSELPEFPVGPGAVVHLVRVTPPFAAPAVRISARAFAAGDSAPRKRHRIDRGAKSSGSPTLAQRSDARMP